MGAKSEPLFDDTYSGLRWRYGLLHRPISTYITSTSVPLPILLSHRPSSDPQFPHGTADWPCELPADVAAHHSLVLIGRVEGDHVECAACEGAGRVRIGPRQGCYVTTYPCQACDGTGWSDQEAFYRRYPGERAYAQGINRATDYHLAMGGSEPD